MHESKEYREAVVETFRRRAIRTVMLIDDHFPTFAELAADDADPAQFPERERARLLYEGFKRRRIPCDVENRVDRLGHEHVDKLRKSDLIVLDYHLGGTDDDPSDALNVLGRLADSQHFNLVVVYTRTRNLDEVWLQLAANLIGGFEGAEETLNEDTIEEWDRLSDKERLPDPSRELLIAYLEQDRSWKHKVDREELDEAEVPKNMQTHIAEAAIHRKLGQFIDGRVQAPDQRRVLTGRCREDVRWLLCGKVFVAVMRKPDLDGHLGELPAEVPAARQEPRDAVADATGPSDQKAEGEGNHEPQGTTPQVEGLTDDVLDFLDRALLDWNPNPFRVIISEIQNMLEVEALATDEAGFTDDVIQTGIAFFLLHAAEEEGAGEEGAFGEAVTGINRQLVDTLGAKVLELLRVNGFASNLLQPLVDALEEDTRFNRAKRLAHVERGVEEHEVLLRLNAYLSTEPQYGGHVTTGTVFMSVVEEADEAEYWMCVSPACDMVPRKPRSASNWLSELFPLRPFTAIRLHPSKDATGLKYANDAHYLFVADGEYRYTLEALAPPGRQPRPEMLVGADAARIDETGCFQAFRIQKLDEVLEQAAAHAGADSNESGPVADGNGGDAPVPEPRFKPGTFKVIGQMRRAYANRLMHHTGFHSTRIGVDYVRLETGGA